ncbi:protein TIFY 4B-like isoform X1 [Musa acuminata AAA Group]|uniref:Protein TIFY n=1 Tax=Musa acuminata subsp. malaccensis TaxID=214687 RepID=A0A804I1E3_MUSAM|nr:PREDICTED: protein TIFY 4B isoform X2 [Musa acuminata subsp. malaccensis]XP_009389429.1 PREDICTED: protein TIFY 4B isoform X2 [Musa acuminata subsp. malaccensis]
MNPGETTPPSPLDKPLAELTEEDIAQLTREDCRRFLKAKGMRRPSWNKSQAIQQVISLKALLEGRPGCDDCPAGGGILQKLLTSSPSEPLSPPQDSPPPAPKEGGSGSQPLAKEPSPYRRRDPIPPPYSAGNPTCQTPIAGADLPHPPEKRCPSPRLTAEVPVGQMTIFYDGMVNVYDGVSADQARSIMELAASPVCFDDPTGAFSPARPPAFRFPPGLPRPAPVPTAPSFVGTFPISPAGTMIHRVADGSDDRRVPRETEPEGPTSRKASLQRYLEKRKDRFKGKKIIGGPTSSNMEMICFNQKLSCPNQNELPNPCDTSFPTLIQQPQSPAKCSPAENETQREKIFFDLNDDG